MFRMHRLGSRESADRCSSERLSAYLDGELSPADQLRVRRHLAHCLRCQATHAEYLQIRQLIREQPDEVVPSGVRRRIIQRLAQTGREPGPIERVPARGGWRPGLALPGAALLLLLLVAALALPRSENVPILAGLAPMRQDSRQAARQAPSEQGGLEIRSLGRTDGESTAPDREHSTGGDHPTRTDRSADPTSVVKQAPGGGSAFPDPGRGESAGTTTTTADPATAVSGRSRRPGLGPDGRLPDSESGGAETGAPAPTSEVAASSPDSSAPGVPPERRPSQPSATETGRQDTGSAEVVAEPALPTSTAVPSGATESGAPSATPARSATRASTPDRAPTSTSASASTDRPASPTSAPAEASAAATSEPGLAEPDLAAPTTPEHAAPALASPTSAPVAVAVASHEETTPAQALATPIPTVVGTVSTPAASVASPTPLTVVEPPVARSEPTPARPAAMPTRGAAAPPLAPTGEPAPSRANPPPPPPPPTVARAPAIAPTAPPPPSPGDTPVRPVRPEPNSAVRSAAVCDIATLPVFAGARAGDSAAAASLGCPVGRGYPMTIQMQQMQAGWLIDPGRPGPIYAVFGVRRWQALTGASIASVLPGAPAQLGGPLGPVQISGGSMQSFEGGVALTGPGGYIFVLLADGRARVY